jgi:hypothetical protein
MYHANADAILNEHKDLKINFRMSTVLASPMLLHKSLQASKLIKTSIYAQLIVFLTFAGGVAASAVADVLGPQCDEYHVNTFCNQSGIKACRQTNQLETIS